MVTVLIRATIIYSLLLLALRLTGKRQVGELQISELITTFMISELAASPIQDLSIPLIYSILPITLLLCIEIILSFWATKSKRVKKLFFGNPSIIVEKGILNQKELSRLRIGTSPSALISSSPISISESIGGKPITALASGLRA